MNDIRFLQEGFDKQLSHFIEECGEALAAAGKTQRWGVWSENPTIPQADRQTNLVWLRSEMEDVLETINRLDKTMQTEFGCDPLKLLGNIAASSSKPAEVEGLMAALKLHHDWRLNHSVSEYVGSGIHAVTAAAFRKSPSPPGRNAALEETAQWHENEAKALRRQMRWPLDEARS